VRTTVGHPDVAGIRQLLMAAPGRSLYRRYGFGDLVSPERWMERPAPPAAASTPGAAAAAGEATEISAS
jgi:hypothetical protein